MDGNKRNSNCFYSIFAKKRNSHCHFKYIEIIPRNYFSSYDFEVKLDDPNDGKSNLDMLSYVIGKSNF